jgi:hypothetical protein
LPWIYTLHIPFIGEKEEELEILLTLRESVERGNALPVLTQTEESGYGY